MKHRKTLLVWSAFALCAVLVLAAMAWLTRGVIAAERQRALAESEREAAEIRADLEERTRLALWRMDAAGAAIMLRENRHAFDRVTPIEDSAEVLLRFEVRRGQPFHFPSLESAGTPRETTEQNIARFRSLLSSRPLTGSDWQRLNTAAIDSQAQWGALQKDPPDESSSPVPASRLRNSQERQVANNAAERVQRARAVDQALDAYHVTPSPAEKEMHETVSETPPSTTPMHAAWLSGELMLLRQISQPANPAADRLQGVWIDWRVLATRLLREIPDLLPGAKLAPAEGHDASEDPLTLVSFPLRLIRPEAPRPQAVSDGITLGAPLKIAWTAVLTALAAAALLAAGIMRLSQRRASFVSAVTHELRTPLTTFRLYSDLLAQTAVCEEKRAGYLRILSREADRLTHLVENVLAFSRIENGGGRLKPRDITAAAMLGEMRVRLEDRLATAGMVLDLDLTPEAAATRLCVDTAVVEHILFNLIDNAAKYAACSSPAIVHLKAAKAHSTHLEIRVRDHGPGIPETERRRIFQPFHKSDRAAAETQPGVGLGLALSRRLARSLGGTLECRTTPATHSSGACFALVIPRTPGS